ncbi:MAG: hypothetical protein HY272_13055 [Gammaproteobacteria bacterium]|nr:hypothetical protein [Gammaproteobacteria bacterium]
MNKQWPLKMVAVTMVLAGCGGGNSSSTGSSATGSLNSSGEVLSSLTRGFTLPSEISAVPADATATAASLRSSRNLFSQLRALTVGTTDSDYNKATTAQSIEERTLEQFSIIETIMKSLAQTNYSDPANINQGPYKAMVAWEEQGQGGRDIKKLEPWVTDSRLIVGTSPNGNLIDINRILVWITEEDPRNPGKTRLTKVEFKIYSAATFNAAGEVVDYGEWDINAKFNDAGTDYFAASSRKQGGISLLKMHMTGEWPMRAILYRAGAAGFGQVEYPVCNGPCGSTPTTRIAKYSYNKDYLAVKDGLNAVVYKDRASKVKMTRRYGLFYKAADAANNIAAGDSVERHKQFGFPVTYIDANGTQFGYYGAWQGRHQLWGGQSGIQAGTTVTRQDFGANATPMTYTVSPTFTGTLTRRAYVTGTLADIQNIPFEIWMNKHLELKYNGAAWETCPGWWDYSGGGAPVCKDFNGGTPALVAFSDFALLQVGANDRKMVNIMRNNAGTMQPYVYLAADPGGIGYTVAGFYPALASLNGGWQATTGGIYTPANGDQLMIDIGGSIYIEFNSVAQAWKQKKLLSFDQQTWTPTFDPAGNTNFTPDLGREYYINANGVNYVVKKIAAGLPETNANNEVKLELQTTANPRNIKSADPKYIFPPNFHHFASHWEPKVHFSFDSDPLSSKFMNLVYLTDDPNTAANDVGSVLAEGQWGLWAYNVSGQPIDVSGNALTLNAAGFPSGAPVEFNWEYSAAGGWGAQQYLIDANGNYVLLSDPVPITVPINAAVDNAGTPVAKPLSLQFDGWMHGLPDLYRDLEVNNWTMSTAISDKIISIPADTEVSDGSVSYYVKPLEVSVFLNVVTLVDIANAGKIAPDIDLASLAILSTVPMFTEHKMGDMPANVVTRYSEGNPVQ